MQVDRRRKGQAHTIQPGDVLGFSGTHPGAKRRGELRDGGGSVSDRTLPGKTLCEDAPASAEGPRNDRRGRRRKPAGSQRRRAVPVVYGPPVPEPQLPLSLWDEIFIDNFAGGGGASTGAAHALLRPVDVALNHNRIALAMHRKNHPTTHHVCENILHADPLKICGYRRVGGIWFSPDCTHHSKARNGRPKSKKIRGLIWSMVHWVNVLRARPVGGAPRVLYLENVEEVESYGPLLPDGSINKAWAGWYFQCILGALSRRGYVVEWAPGDGKVYRWDPVKSEAVVIRTDFSARACDRGAPTIRRRLYLIARCDGVPITWPDATHGSAATDAVLAGRLKPYEMTAKYLDFSLPCPSIFLSRSAARAFRCKRPLVKATMKRIARGVDREVLKAAKPFILELTHQGNSGVASIDDPIKTITAANRGEKGLVSPTLVPTAAAGTLIKLRGNPDSHGAPYSLGDPVHTISAQGNHHGFVAAYLAQHNGGAKGHQSYGHPVTDPISSITGKGCQQQVVFADLIQYNGTDQCPSIKEAAHTITTKDRLALFTATGVIPPLTPDQIAGARRVASFLRAHGVKFDGEFAMVAGFILVDIGMRMLTPRELFSLQGFPPHYVIDRGLDVDEHGRAFEITLTRTEQIEMCGNSVCPPMAEALIAANNPEMRCDRALAA